MKHSFDPRGDCAPGNDSTTGSTRRENLLKVRSLRTEIPGRSALEGASQVSVTANGRATYSSESLLGG